MDHPSLLKSDRDQLDSFCRMFELDWRGDQTYKGSEEFMFNVPIHLDGTNIKSHGLLTQDVMDMKLRNACVPYVEETAKKLQS